MLLLTSTSDLIQVVTGSARTVHVHASWIDNAAGTITPGRTNTIITTAATTTVVGSPAASTQRNVQTLIIENTDSSLNDVITVRHTDGTTIVELFDYDLSPSGQITFMDGTGFFVTDNSGARITAGIQGVAGSAMPLGYLGSDGWIGADGMVGLQGPQGLQGNAGTGGGSVVVVQPLASDVSNSTTTAAKVTGLDKAVGVGTWVFKYTLLTQSAATTTGQKFSVNHTGTLTAFVADMRYTDASATASTGAPSQAANASTAQVYASYSARAKSTAAGMGPTLSVDAANSDMLVTIEGMMIVTGTGNIELYHASEVAAASTVRTGSSLILFQVA